MLIVIFFLVCVVVASFCVVMAVFAEWFGWIPLQLIHDVVFWCLKITLEYARRVAKLPLEKLLAVATAAALLHSLVVTGMPMWMVQQLRGESAILRWTLRTPLRGVIDRLVQLRYENKFLRFVCGVVEFCAQLCLMAVGLVARIVSDPAVSRMVTSSLLIPLWAAIGLWLAMPTAVMPVLRAVVPAGWLDLEGSGGEKEQLVIATALLGAVLGGVYILLMHFKPTVAAWLAGTPPPLHFLVGLTAALLVALVFSGMYADGNTRQAMVVPGHHPTDLASMLEAEDAAKPKVPDVRTAHVSALLVCLSVACSMHIALPVLNRKHYARLWLLDSAMRPSLASAVLTVKAAKDTTG